jgi:hypothetical protein
MADWGYQKWAKDKLGKLAEAQARYEKNRPSEFSQTKKETPAKADKPAAPAKADKPAAPTPSGNIGSRVDFSDDKIGPNMGKVNKPKAKPKAAAIKPLKDTSGDYYTANGISGDMGSASGEVGADMSQINKGGYDPEEGMKRGGKVKKMAGGGKISSASSRGDGCAQRGKTKGRFV